MIARWSDYLCPLPPRPAPRAPQAQIAEAIEREALAECTFQPKMHARSGVLAEQAAPPAPPTPRHDGPSPPRCPLRLARGTIACTSSVA